jgi:hypothetical protein
MNILRFGFQKVSVLMFTLVLSVGFLVFSDVANANNACDAWVDYYVDGDRVAVGSCTIGTGSTDFLNGTGIAKCTVSKSGNINCNCHGEHIIPLDSALIFNETDQCCITINGQEPILSDITFGLGTPSGIANATCKVKK